jgi:hypothetical protein
MKLYTVTTVLAFAVVAFGGVQQPHVEVNVNADGVLFTVSGASGSLA